MDVGDAGDAEALELVREARNDHVVPRDLDGGGLDEEAVAQRGGDDGAGGSDEKSAAGEGNRHRGKVTSPPVPLSTFDLTPLAPSPRSWRGGVCRKRVLCNRNGYRDRASRAPP